MRSPEQIKGKVRNIAKEKSLKPQEVLQIYMFERIIERVSVSQYHDNVILKGGLLISSMIGIGERTTMDIDTTIQGLSMEEGNILHIYKEILGIDVGDGIQFIINDIGPIMEDDVYSNFRISLTASYGKMNIPMKIDITTGDVITPGKIEYKYPFMFDDVCVNVMAYPLETILAEKFETIIRRNVGNTRGRDFYDLYMLYKLRENEIRWDVLRQAVLATSAKRYSVNDMSSYEEIVNEMKQSDFLKRIWNKYKNENTYIGDLSLDNVFDIVMIFGRRMAL